MVKIHKYKYTLEIIRNIVSEIYPDIEVVYDYEKEIGKTNRQMKRYAHCKCRLCNYEWDIKLQSLLQKNKDNPKCPICVLEYTAKKYKYSLDEIKSKLKDMNPNIEIISNEYKNNKTSLKCRCKIDNYKWRAKWSDLSQGTGCPLCAIRSRSGEGSSNWKGGISSLRNYLRSHLDEWKRDSFKKYNYKCDISGINKNLNIHHLYSFNLIFQEIIEIAKLPIYQEINKYTNEELDKLVDICLKLHNKYGLGVCLCKEEHKKFHSEYGKSNNTPKQYIEYKENRLKELHNIENNKAS